MHERPMAMRQVTCISSTQPPIRNLPFRPSCYRDGLAHREVPRRRPCSHRVTMAALTRVGRLCPVALPGARHVVSAASAFARQGAPSSIAAARGSQAPTNTSILSAVSFLFPQPSCMKLSLTLTATRRSCRGARLPR